MAQEEKNEKTPLNPSNEKRIQYVDVNIDKQNVRDPMLSQLPKALLPYVTGPKDHQAKLVFVERGVCYAIIHWIIMVVVQKGEIALTQNGDEPEILGPGRHVLLSPWNRLIKVFKQTAPIINNGPIHIIKVQAGELGYATDMKNGHPVLLTQGTHMINSPTFEWQRFITLREPQTILGQLQIIRVETGYVGYCYKQGELVILKPGLHLIEPPDRFGKIITTQMTILDLPRAIHETSDYVPLAIKAAVFYRIVDPLKALVRIQNIPKQIEETSVATLAGIIRGSSLSDVASRSTPFYHPKQKQKMRRKLMKNKKEFKQDDDKQDYDDDDDMNTAYKSIPIQPSSSNFDMSGYDNVPPSAPPYFQHVHDEFIQQLHDHVSDEWGIEIQNIRIESLKIADQKLQSNISAQAIKVSNVHNQYMLLMKQQEITTVEAETRAQKMKIDTTAEALKIEINSKAKANSIVVEAEANKKAKILQGQGEYEYSKLLESTALGKQLASMKVQSDALNGLKQIAYVPHLPSLLSKNMGIYADRNMLLPDVNSSK